MILDRGAFWKPEARERRLSVVSGRLWATRKGIEDYILGPGDNIELKGTGWLAQTLGGTASEFTTSAAPGSPSLAETGQSMLHKSHETRGMDIGGPRGRYGGGAESAQ